MLALQLTPGLTRAAADAALAPAVPDPAVREFLLPNLRFGAAPSWRIGLAEIAAALPAIEGWSAAGALSTGRPWCCGASAPTTSCRSTGRCSARCSRMRGSSTLRDAGHWLHADAPEAFIATLAGVPA